MSAPADHPKTSNPHRDEPPAQGQGHQPLPGENPPRGEGAKRKHVQNADLPAGEGHQPLPGENPAGGKD